MLLQKIKRCLAFIIGLQPRGSVEEELFPDFLQFLKGVLISYLVQHVLILKLILILTPLLRYCLIIDLLSHRGDTEV